MDPFWQLVRGRSMLPALADGDEVLLEPAAKLAVGDVVVARVPSRRGTVLHRVIRLDGAWVVTRGDACLRRDPPVPRANVLFRATAFRRSGAGGTIPPAPGAFRRLWLRCVRRFESARGAPGRWWRARRSSSSTANGSSD